MSNDIFKTAIIGKSPISIGRFTYGFKNLNVRQWGEGASLKIGSFCSLADNITVFLGGNHRTDWITTFPFGHIYHDELNVKPILGHPSTKGDVIIGNDVWIGSGVTIMSGLKIGDGAVLSANACVIKDVAPYTIVGGNPAKSIKQRFDNEIIELLLKLQWWDLSTQNIKNISSILSCKPTKNSIVKLISTYRK
jgi:acetyltransferase-like isoleucine patch superfamily enzyme